MDYVGFDPDLRKCLDTYNSILESDFTAIIILEKTLLENFGAIQHRKKCKISILSSIWTSRSGESVRIEEESLLKLKPN